MDLGTAKLADFQPLIGTPFHINDGTGNPIALELVEAHALPTHSGTPREPFSLIFRGPSDRPLEQQTHTLEHQGIGPVELFLVPIGPAGTGGDPEYQAIFN